MSMTSLSQINYKENPTFNDKNTRRGISKGKVGSNLIVWFLDLLKT